MKAILALLLIGAAFVALAPTASACEVSDPTGTTYTCIDQYDFSSGDCETSGYSYTGTSAYSSSALGSLGANNYDNCWNDAFGSGSSSGTGAWLNSNGLYASANTYEYANDFGSGSGTSAFAQYGSTYAGAGQYDSSGFCQVYVYANTPAGYQYQAQPC